MPTDETTDDPDSHDEPIPSPPPSPPGVSLETHYLGQMIAWSGGNQIGEIRTARRDNRRDHRAMLGKLDDIRSALVAVDADIDEIKKAGKFERAATK